MSTPASGRTCEHGPWAQEIRARTLRGGQPWRSALGSLAGFLLGGGPGETLPALRVQHFPPVSPLLHQPEFPFKLALHRH